MSKAILFFAILVIATTGAFAKVKVSTNLKLISPGQSLLKLNGEKMVVNLSELPDDDGVSNWGDLVYKSRQDQDELLLRDIVIYSTVSSNDQTLKYSASFDSSASITSVRVLNVGRERAYGYEIDVASNDVDIIYILPAERDPRVIIEVYGFTN